MVIKKVILPAHIIILSLFLLLVTSCGGGGGSSSDSTIPQVPITALPGAADALAVGAVYSLDAITGIPDSEIETDDTGVKIARSQLDIGFSKSATVKEINDFLRSIDGRIVAMLDGVAGFLVRFPDPGSLAGLEALVTQLEANPLIRWVQVTYYGAPDELPSDIPPDSLAITPLAHHLAIGGHALWNLRDILSTPGIDPPVIIIADAFGGGVPNDDFEAIFVDSDFATNNPDTHGYRVSSVIVADFGGATERGMVTGLYPGKPLVRVVDIQEPLTIQGAGYRSLLIISDYAPYPVILNTSLGHVCDNAANASAWCNEATARGQAITWIEKVRDSGLEDRFIQITAAGNIKSAVPDNTDARFSSQFASAALFSDLTDDSGAPIPPLTNTLVVENLMRTVHTADDPPKPACMDTSSKYSGNISAIGTDIAVLDGASNGVNVSTGTSYATPQVTGLATWVWALAPGLSNHEVIKLLRDTAETVDISNPANAALNCSAVVPAKVINAYSAALATDAIISSSSANPPLRSTLMDVNNDGPFDENDLQLIHDKHEQQNGDLDYSRYDLNGDGYTGGEKTKRFDLNSDAAFTTVSQTIGDGTVEFSESAVSDNEIMCYYAYSEIYTGNEEARDDLIGPMCGKQDCIYHEVYNGPGDFSYEKACWLTAPFSWLSYRHEEANNYRNISITLRDCIDPLIKYSDYFSECSSDHYNRHVEVQYGYNGWADESGIYAVIWTLNDVFLGNTYVCTPGGTLMFSESGVQDEEYGDLETCYAALKTHLPGDAMIFDYPGDCHDWWNHNGVSCLD